MLAASALGNIWIVRCNHQLMGHLKIAVADAQARCQASSAYADTWIHMPPSGQCPAGFEVARDLFERGGDTITGCARIGRQPSGGKIGSIDRLGPGESIHVTVPIPVPLPGWR